MNYSLFSFWANIFGFIAGGISLVGFIVAVCRPHLPSNKIKTLETLVHETESIFNEAVEAGLLVPEFVEETQENLTGLKEQTCTLRARAYNVTTLGRDYAEFLCGTSNAIGLACQSVKKIRAEVITSSEERRRLMQMRPEQIQPRAAPSANPMRCHPMATPSTLIPRPSSCPPVLPAWKLENMRNVPVGNSEPLGISGVSRPDGSSSDPLRTDSDVRRVDVQL